MTERSDFSEKVMGGLTVPHTSRARSVPIRVRIRQTVKECQGGVSTYVRALERSLPGEGVVIVPEEGDYDLLLHVGPHRYDGVPPEKGRRSVMVVHDLIPEVLLGDEAVRTERARALASADAVIAVSAWTKADLIREYDINPDKIHVVHHGVYTVVDQAEKADAGSPTGPSPYLLYVGKRNPYKRFRWFLRAVAPLMWQHPRLRIQCTGEPFCRREWAWIVLLGLWGRVTVRRFTDQEMPTVYARAEALVYPSINEGFGLPVLEAMAAGCPVVLSRSASLPEVAGDAGAYFEADRAGSLRHLLSNLLRNDPEARRMRNAFIEKGYRQAARFSWEKCARETANVLRSCL